MPGHYFERAIEETEAVIRASQAERATAIATNELGNFLMAAIQTLGEPWGAEGEERGFSINIDNEQLWSFCIATDAELAHQWEVDACVTLNLLYEGEDDPHLGGVAASLDLVKKGDRWMDAHPPKPPMPYDEVTGISRFVVACVKKYEEQNGITRREHRRICHA